MSESDKRVRKPKAKKASLPPDELASARAELAAKRDEIYQRLLSTSDPNVIFPPWAAARYLTVCESTLATWRRVGPDTSNPDKPLPGPKYVRLSAVKVGYRKGALDEYTASREYESTSADPHAPIGPRRKAAAE